MREKRKKTMNIKAFILELAYKLLGLQNAHQIVVNNSIELGIHTHYREH